MTSLIPGGVPGTAVARKVTGSIPETMAVTVCSPGAEPSVQRVDERPSSPVGAVSGATVPPCPTTQATGTPATGFWVASRT